MRSRVRALPLALLTAASATALLPALAQRAPESILPPGFGQPATPPEPTRTPRQEAPAPGNIASPANPPPSNSAATAEVPDIALKPPASTADAIGSVIDALGDESLLVDVAPEITPPQARRSLEQVGLLDASDGGFGPNGFASDGRYLTTLMMRMKAPIASRWASILLRRALLSPSAIPAGVNGADWVAERAWLLLRMGEADMARALVARVDAENYTPRLYEVALQAALATGDLASICPVVDAGAAVSNARAWPLVQAMCAALSGESGTATALIDRARDRGRAGGIDVLLAEKVIGAGGNSRRAVNLQWDGVDRLTAWRFGLATATGAIVPEPLYETSGPQVRAWLARAPLIAPEARAQAAQTAAILGVFSASALIAFNASIWANTDPGDRANTTGSLLRDIYMADDTTGRLAALRAIWGNAAVDRYAGRLLTAYASVAVPPTEAVGGEDRDALIAAMLSAGLDLQAARWTNVLSVGSPAWSMLAVGAPRSIGNISAASVRGAFDGTDDRRVKLLLAGLAGLGRLSAGEASSLAERFAVPLGRETSWTRALDRAVVSRAQGEVALIAAAGLQSHDWRNVPPEHLYRIVAALRRVGLEPEARMIAAEAMMRSG